MYRHKTIYYTIAFIGLMVWFLGNSHAQKGRSSAWKEKNDRGSRYEGSYNRLVGNPSIELVSLMRHLEPYSFGQGQTLTARFYSPQAQKYNLKAEELKTTRFYWLEDKQEQAEVGWNHFSDWPVDFLLKRLAIYPNNLGVLVRLGDPGSRTFSPVSLTVGEQIEKLNRYTAQFRLGRSSSGGQYRIYVGQHVSENSLLDQARISVKSTGKPFPITFSADKLPQEGWYTVKVFMREKNTLDDFTYTFSFYHQP